MKESDLAYFQGKLDEINLLERKIEEITNFIKVNEFERLSIKGLELNKNILLAKSIIPFLSAEKLRMKKTLKTKKDYFEKHKLIKKCKCTKESSWLLIDDSFNKESNSKGGSFAFQEEHEYDFYENETAFGKYMLVVHPKHEKENLIGFEEKRFYKHLKY